MGNIATLKEVRKKKKRTSLSNWRTVFFLDRVRLKTVRTTHKYCSLVSPFVSHMGYRLSLQLFDVYPRVEEISGYIVDGESQDSHRWRKKIPIRKWEGREGPCGVRLEPEGHLGGSVVEHLSAFGSGHDPRVLESSPTSGSPQGTCFSLCLCLCLCLSLSLCVCLRNE